MYSSPYADGDSDCERNPPAEEGKRQRPTKTGKKPVDVTLAIHGPFKKNSEHREPHDCRCA
jgi:hypothetical protein